MKIYYNKFNDTLYMIGHALVPEYYSCAEGWKYSVAFYDWLLDGELELIYDSETK
jgi:hypothetical protein